jgi:16S rRNA (uracil1498-N3)-methyltransferase
MSKLFRLDRVLDPTEVSRPLVLGEVLSLDPHRFGRVLRLAVGDRLTLVDPTGAAFEVVALSNDPPQVEVVATASLPTANPARPLEVWVPLLKGGKAEDLVRPLVELGATLIVPYSCRRSVVRLDDKRAAERQKRMQAIADEACQQCGRTDRPTVAPYAEHLPKSGPGVFLWEEGGGPPTHTTLAAADRLLSGPEGGLDPSEVEQLVDLGWQPLWLGHRILRAETAVLTLTTLAQSARGELGG